MTKEEIRHLGNLARLALSETEVEAFAQELEAILGYVSKVSDIAGDGALPKVVGVTKNVMRSDEVTNTPGQYTDVLLESAPDRVGRLVKVKKILDQSE